MLKKIMAKVFIVKDKTGREIYLSKERWKHVQKHPRMSGQIEKIKETLMIPLIIQDFEYDSKVKFYFKYYKENKEYLFISVKYLNGKGFVITSFFTDKIIK